MKKSGSFTQSNRGASLVLVSILSTLVIGISVTLIVVSAMIISQAGRRTREDQAYELATSFSSKIEFLILNELDNTHASMLELSDGLQISDSGFPGIPDSYVTAVVTEDTDIDGNAYYILTVTAVAAGEKYIKITEYTGNALNGYSRR